MSFALTAFRARGIRIDGVQPDRAIQQAILQITGLTTDVALDIGADAGTFWTAAVADATYGTLATNALLALQTIVAQAQCVSRLFLPEIVGRVLAAATSGTAYTLALQNSRPNYTFAASNGLATATVIIEWVLNPGVQPVDLVYNVAPA